MTRTSLLCFVVLCVACQSGEQSEAVDLDQLIDEFYENPAYSPASRIYTSDNVVLPYETCVDAAQTKQGEDYCFINFITGYTPPGENYLDHGNCEDVRSAGPQFFAAVRAPDFLDERASDANYQAEVEWVTSQLESSACSCCHNSRSGYATKWDMSAGPLWITSLEDDAILIAAGLVGSDVFGFAPEHLTNGFLQAGNVFSSTDPERMLEFFLKQVEYRGLGEDDIAVAEARYQSLTFADSQQVLRACESTEGMGADNRIDWTYDGMRFLSILRADAEPPEYPPEENVPEGTLWRIETPHSVSEPLPRGMVYGEVPDGVIQVYPETGAPEPLVPGTTYKIATSSRFRSSDRTYCEFTYQRQ